MKKIFLKLGLLLFFVASTNAAISRVDIYERYDRSLQAPVRWAIYEELNVAINNTPLDTVNFTNTRAVIELDTADRTSTSPSPFTASNIDGIFVDFQQIGVNPEESTTLILRPFGQSGMQRVEIRVTDIQFSTPGQYITGVTRTSSNLFQSTNNPSISITSPTNFAPGTNSFTIIYTAPLSTTSIMNGGINQTDTFTITFGPVAVPEPSSVSLILISAMAFILRRKR